MILVIGNKGCHNCEKTKAILNQNNIKYEYKQIIELSLDKQEYYLNIAKENNHLMLPIIIEKNIDSEKLVSIEDILKKNEVNN
jgi:glutaredoxin